MYINLDISLKSGSLDKTRMIYSEPRDNLLISVKGLITSLDIGSKASPKKHKKARHAIVNVSMKELSKITRESQKFTYKSYERIRPKHEPTDSYFCILRHLVKCMMRSDALNSHVYPIGAEMAATKKIPISHVFSMKNSEL